MLKEIKEMRELVDNLNKATEAYDKGHPVMTDKEWDEKYFSLLSLERKSGISFSDSPTNSVHFVTVSNLKKVQHNHKMLSLDKTKDTDEVKSFIGSKDVIAMLKMDGLTCSLRYYKGLLVGAETRGNGEVGEDIYHNALVIPTIPRHIETEEEEVIVDGEIICSYNDFETFSSEYKNPRNFASGSIRLLDSKECSKRKLQFVAWDAITGCKEKTLHGRLEHLRALGFSIVPYMPQVREFNDVIENLQDIAKSLSYPIDGIVFKYDDCDYYDSLGYTDHHFRGGLAYKFYDEEYETRLKTISWTMGRTGVLTPVAVFEPIEIDGTTVERASLHNYSIMREVLGSCAYVGQKIKVYKANQIIPQISNAVKFDYGTVISRGGVSANDELEICPICGGGTEIIKSADGVMNMYCSNPNCEGKLINRIDHYCSKKGLDIKGLSKATLEKLLDWSLIEDIEDIYLLCDKRDEWINKPGFGEKSVDKILNAIEESRNCNLIDFIAALGIPLVGKTVAKQLVQYIDSYEDFRDKINNGYDFTIIEGFGPAISNAICDFDYTLTDRLAKYHLNITKTLDEEKTKNLEGMTFVITGKLKSFKNRDELKAVIESKGGKVAGSVSKNTNYLINNDNLSTTAKNKKAQELGIPIITEETFLKNF